MASTFLKLVLLVALVAATALGSRPMWQKPNSASVIRWNGCAANDETYAILAIQDGSNPKSTFAHSSSAHNVWQIFACDIANPGNLVLQFGREIVVGASTVTRANSVRFNVNSDGVEDLEFNRNGEWVSLTGLNSPKNSALSSTNIVARTNIVASLTPASAFTLGKAYTSNQNNPANNCRQGTRVALGSNGQYAALFTGRNYPAASTAVVFLCNYDTDATATSICAAGVYKTVTLVSGAATGFTCTPVASDLAFAANQWIVSTSCGVNQCGTDFTTCTAVSGAQWYCESSSADAAGITAFAGTAIPSTATFPVAVALGFTLTLNAVTYNTMHVGFNGIVGFSNGAAPVFPTMLQNPYGNQFVAAFFSTGVVYNGNAPQGIKYLIAANTVRIQWTLATTGGNGVVVADATIFQNDAVQQPVLRYYYNGDPGVSTTFNSVKGGVAQGPQQWGCTVTPVTSDTIAILPYKTTGYALFTTDFRSRFQALTVDPTNNFQALFSPVSRPAAIATEGVMVRSQRCCKQSILIAAAQSGTAGFVAYAGYGGPFYDIYVRTLTQGPANWQVTAVGKGLSAGGNEGLIGFTPPGANPNNILRGIAATYVANGMTQQPFVVVSKLQAACRDTSAAQSPATSGTWSGQLFEYLAAVCKGADCQTGVDWRILADSNQLATGNLAETYTTASTAVLGVPAPDLLSLTLSTKTGLPVLLLGSTAGLPVLLECQDYQCNAAQVTVTDDYLAGHYGEGFVVAGTAQLTIVSQGAWGISTEDKPYAQRWTAYTTSPDGVTTCSAATTGQSYNILGRVQMCTRLPRSAFSAYNAAVVGTSTRPISTALFSWAEIGGRLRLYASENGV